MSGIPVLQKLRQEYCEFEVRTYFFNGIFRMFKYGMNEWVDR